jgi:hypothetical protein
MKNRSRNGGGGGGGPGPDALDAPALNLLFALITPRGGCCAPFGVCPGKDEQVCAQYSTGSLSQKVQKVELSGGRVSHLVAWPHVHISRLDMRRCGELRDCGVPNSGRGLETWAENTHCRPEPSTSQQHKSTSKIFSCKYTNHEKP